MKTKKQTPTVPDTTPEQPEDWRRSPPPDIGEAALRWHAEILSVYQIADVDGLLTLHSLVAAFDRAERCAALIRQHGEMVLGRDGQVRVNPLCAAERDARAQILMALRRLDISPTEPARPGRPAGGGR